jgi:uncharacterized protein (TIGR02145 family)
MKKFSFPLVITFLLTTLNCLSQRPTIELTFTAKYQSQYLMLDSIYIQNLTHPGDTMLFAPDTVLLLDYINDIPDYNGTAKSSFSVSSNYPNPSVDGKTSINVFIPEKEDITIRIVDLLGREVVNYENTLDAGNHHFTFIAGKEKCYVLSVICNDEIRSVKIVNAGNGSYLQGSMVYDGIMEAALPLKSQNAITGFDFSLGDQLRFIGYAKTIAGIDGSDVIEAAPTGNEGFIFEILEGHPCSGIPTVTYEGQTYTTVQIGNQCWFKENLNVGTMINGIENQTNNSVVEKYCYDDDPSNCVVYGGLYQWDEMMQFVNSPGTQGICPTSWHLPTDGEWTELTDFLGGEATAGGAMKETGTIHWIPPNTGANNSSGFKALPAGGRSLNGYFSVLGRCASFWSSTEYYGYYAWYRYLNYGSSDMYRNNYNKSGGFSVRCVKDGNPVTIPMVSTAIITVIGQTTATGGGHVTDDGGSEVTARGVCWSTSQNPTIADSHTSDGTGTGVFVSNLTGLTPNTQYFVKAYATNSVGTAYGDEVSFTTPHQPCPGIPTVTYEDQTYNTIQIGDQCWLKENLNVGTMIDGVIEQTNNSLVEKYCYNNDPANCSIYGGLYQWDEMMQYTSLQGTQGICPEGWHISTDGDWCIITQFIDATVECDANGFSGTDVGIKMKSTYGWDSGGNGTDSFAFTSLPSGFFSNTLGFSGLGLYCYFWTSSLEYDLYAWARSFIADDGGVNRDYNIRTPGISVRCIKNN